MVTEKHNLQTELVASEDGKQTYEIRRKWADVGRKGLVLELYPTLTADRCGEMDLSTMHLMNHTSDFGWSALRIVNLYSTVFASKPLSSLLEYDDKNIAYIEEILESKDISDYDIVIATGNSLSTHIKTVEAKLDILHMLQDKKLDKQVKCIVPEFIDEKVTQGTHPLFLGLHHSKEKWSLIDYDIQTAIEELNGHLVGKTIKESDKSKKDKRKGQKKGKNENVLPNKEST